MTILINLVTIIMKMKTIDKLIEKDIYNLIKKIMNSNNNPQYKTKFNIKCEIEDINNNENIINLECEFNLLKFNGEIIK